MQFLSISYMCDVSILSPPLPTTPSKVQDLFLISVGVDVHVCSLLSPFSVVCLYICSRMFLNYFIDEAIRTSKGDFHFLCNRVTAPADRSLSGSRNNEVKYRQGCPPACPPPTPSSLALARWASLTKGTLENGFLFGRGDHTHRLNSPFVICDLSERLIN